MVDAMVAPEKFKVKMVLSAPIFLFVTVCKLFIIAIILLYAGLLIILAITAAASIKLLTTVVAKFSITELRPVSFINCLESIQMSESNFF